MYWRFLFIIACVAVARPAVAEQRWTHRVWNIDHGLVDNAVLDVQQSSDGFLWLSTPSGMMRFDGMEFIPDPLSMELAYQRRIDLLFIDSRDRRWMTTRNGDIFCLDRDRVVLKIPNDPSQRNTGHLSFVEDKTGVIYLCFRKGNVFRVRDEKVETIIADELANSNTKLLVKDGLGQIWFSGGTNGLWIIQDGRFQLRERLTVDNLAGARSGGAWICSGNELWKYTITNALEKVSSFPEGLRLIRQNAFLEDSRGCVWIGTMYSGLFCFEDKVFSKVPSPSENICSIDQDVAGNIWVGTMRGLSQVTCPVTHFIVSEEGNVNQNVFSVCEDASNTFWVARNTGRGQISKSVDRASLESSTFASWSVVSNAINLTFCAVSHPVSGLWFGTEGSGIYLWQNGAVATNLTSRNGLGSDFVNALHITRDGVLWIGSLNLSSKQAFLQSWQAGVFKNYQLPADSDMITAITSDSHGRCWFSTYNGYLFRLDGDGIMSDETAILASDRCPILSLSTTPEGSLWIVFSGQGLGRLKNGHFMRYRTEQGLLDDFISRCLFDGEGRLWLVGKKGFFSVRMHDFDEVDAGRSMTVQSVGHGKNEGMPLSRPMEHFWPSAIRDSAGRLLFGMQGGLVIIDPKALDHIQPPPPVVITRVKRDGRTIADLGLHVKPGRSAQPAPVDLRNVGRNSLRLPPDTRQFEISFTALSYKSPEYTKFKCRLTGHNDDWRDIGFERTVSYYDMNPGDYLFQVIACNSDGVWSRRPAEIAFTVEPYWWDTIGFRVATPLLFFGAILAGVIIFLRHRQKIQIERLELIRATENERARIAADLHDEIGSGLTEVGMTGDFALRTTTLEEQAREYVNEMIGKTKEMTESLDEIVWAANPTHDSVASLVGYSTRYIQRMMGKMPVKLKLEIERNLPETTMSAGLRHQIFLAFREAVTNIVRHAGASEVSLTIEIKGHVLAMTIQDNGHGMDLVATAQEGDGLSNMRNRLEKIGGTCLINSELGKGTRITFEIKL